MWEETPFYLISHSIKTFNHYPKSTTYPRIAESTLSPVGGGRIAKVYASSNWGGEKTTGSVISTPVRRLTLILALPPPTGNSEESAFRKALHLRAGFLFNPIFQIAMNPLYIRQHFFISKPKHSKTRFF